MAIRRRARQRSQWKTTSRRWLSARTLRCSLINSGNATSQLRRSITARMTLAELQSLALNITTFNCANVNGNTVILTVTDVNGNTAPAPPTRDHRRQRRPNRGLPKRHGAIGQYWKWFDNCSGRQQRQLRQLCDCILGPEPNAFVCSEVGANTEILTVTDVNGNSTTCTQCSRNRHYCTCFHQQWIK
jgi:hypothetical protein